MPDVRVPAAQATPSIVISGEDSIFNPRRIWLVILAATVGTVSQALVDRLPGRLLDPLHLFQRPQGIPRRAGQHGGIENELAVQIDGNAGFMPGEPLAFTLAAVALLRIAGRGDPFGGGPFLDRRLQPALPVGGLGHVLPEEVEVAAEAAEKTASDISPARCGYAACRRASGGIRLRRSSDIRQARE